MGNIFSSWDFGSYTPFPIKKWMSGKQLKSFMEEHLVYLTISAFGKETPETKDLMKKLLESYLAMAIVDQETNCRDALLQIVKDVLAGATIYRATPEKIAFIQSVINCIANGKLKEESEWESFGLTVQDRYQKHQSKQKTTVKEQKSLRTLKEFSGGSTAQTHTGEISSPRLAIASSKSKSSTPSTLQRNEVTHYVSSSNGKLEDTLKASYQPAKDMVLKKLEASKEYDTVVLEELRQAIDAPNFNTEQMVDYILNQNRNTTVASEHGRANANALPPPAENHADCNTRYEQLRKKYSEVEEDKNRMQSVYDMALEKEQRLEEELRIAYSSSAERERQLRETERQRSAFQTDLSRAKEDLTESKDKIASLERDLMIARQEESRLIKEGAENSRKSFEVLFAVEEKLRTSETHAEQLEQDRKRLLREYELAPVVELP